MDSSLLNSLFDQEERHPLSVTELNELVKERLEAEYSNVWLEGEINNFYKAASGHWYFTLTDGNSQIKAACFKSLNWRVRFEPENGLSVRVRGKLSVYVPRGEYQITVESLQPVGEGAMKIAFEQIRSKLDADGLFDPAHKRKLPYFPQCVGVVTSPNGAAIFDILNVLTRRTQSVSILLIPSLVQGENAPAELRNGILLANEFNQRAETRQKIDVLIVGRGGGSSEDLAAFNEEYLARAIFESEIPVISAVGHETDVSISDLVADVRAPTPSAAAEIVAESEDLILETLEKRVTEMHHLLRLRMLHEQRRLETLQYSEAFTGFRQNVKDELYQIEDVFNRSVQAMREQVRENQKVFQALAARITPSRLARRFSDQKSRFAVLAERTAAAERKLLAAKENGLHIAMARLDAMSPLAVLERGYSLTTKPDGTILRTAGSVNTDEEINVRLANGKLRAKVLSKEKVND
ncbi:MAG: exodeoxyribonuclease VII large subunit [Pyrinomonadaceae bacterium]